VAQPGENPLPVVAVSKTLIALCLALLMLSLASAGGVALSGSAATTAACVAILVFGLPHGSLDLEIVRHEYASGAASMMAVLLLYVGLATAMWAMWNESPVAGLSVFFCIATVHFGEDWPELDSTFLAQGMASALLTAPVWLHTIQLQSIFTALTGTVGAVYVADLLLLLAPTSMAVAAVGLWTLWQAGHHQRTATAALALAGMILLPPVIGFACFFCLYHSPRHFAEALTRVVATARVHSAVIAVTIAALGLSVVLFCGAARADVSERIIVASFMTLSLLTVPHMLMPLLVDAVAARRTRLLSHTKQGDDDANQGSPRIRAQG
jgi:Brp/Blh family beta-carotene 15,15'-monooxygenase